MPQYKLSIDVDAKEGFDRDMILYAQAYISDAIVNTVPLTKSEMARRLHLTVNRLSRLLKQLDLEKSFWMAKLRREQ